MEDQGPVLPSEAQDTTKGTHRRRIPNALVICLVAEPLVKETSHVEDAIVEEFLSKDDEAIWKMPDDEEECAAEQPAAVSMPPDTAAVETLAEVSSSPKGESTHAFSFFPNFTSLLTYLQRI